MSPFTQYIALGDSISIDLYPGLDYHHGKVAPPRRGLGAASLLQRNADDVHPEFRGRDLVSIAPDLASGDAFVDLAEDGATTWDVLERVRGLDRTDDPVVVTITAGGNDLLAAASVRGFSGDTDPAGETAARLHAAVTELLARMPNARVIVGTVYDPTDGTYILPLPNGDRVDLRGVSEWLPAYNDAVRALAASDPRLHLADIHEHFRGHGLAAASTEDFWYWPESIIEPGVRGASEVRRLFLAAI